MRDAWRQQREVHATVKEIIVGSTMPRCPQIAH
jgi:hypothetical protein